MDINEFNSLSSVDKLDYILSRLHYAYDLFKIIYESGCGFEQSVLDELEYLGSEFSRIGLKAEEHDFSDVYNELNENITKLTNIVSVVEEYLYKNNIIN